VKSHLVFPSFIYQNKIRFKGASTPKQNQEFLTEILKIREIDDKGRRWSEKNYPGGYTSYATLNELHKFSTTFELLKKQLDQEVKNFAQSLEMDLQGRKLVLTTLWANVMPTHVVHSMHIHPLSTISGTYYVQTPKNCSAIKFEDPRLVNFMASPPRKAKARPENQRFIAIQPQAGEVILFESWMRHEVPPNPSSQERVSLSFNYDWI
jgi:uncharacterized protein (TIGR02466 family)